MLHENEAEKKKRKTTVKGANFLVQWNWILALLASAFKSFQRSQLFRVYQGQLKQILPRFLAPEDLNYARWCQRPSWSREISPQRFYCRLVPLSIFQSLRLAGFQLIYLSQIPLGCCCRDCVSEGAHPAHDRTGSPTVFRTGWAWRAVCSLLDRVGCLS